MKQPITRKRPGQKVMLVPSADQPPESVEKDFANSFALGDELAANGTESWRSTFRRIGPVKVMAYKEVGPPPWRWPRIAFQPWERGGRFIAGWRSTAYAICVLWSPGTGTSGDGNSVDRDDGNSVY